MHPFRAAVEARDVDAAVDLLAEDVVFRSPVVFKPYRGREVVRVILAAVVEVFEDFAYVREIAAPDAADHALRRPLSAALALAEAMGAKLASAG